jgi:uncharacterized protein YchJ
MFQITIFLYARIIVIKDLRSILNIFHGSFGYRWQVTIKYQIDKSIICRDVIFLRQQSKQNIQRYIDERLPEEYEKCMVGLNAILREAWNTSQQARQEREKIQALSLAKECYSMKLDLLTNATVVDDAVRFMARHQNQNQTKEKDKDESNKHNKDEENKDKVINEFEIKNEASETAVATANQVF